ARPHDGCNPPPARESRGAALHMPLRITDYVPPHAWRQRYTREDPAACPEAVPAATFWHPFPGLSGRRQSANSRIGPLSHDTLPRSPRPCTRLQTPLPEHRTKSRDGEIRRFSFHPRPVSSSQPDTSERRCPPKWLAGPDSPAYGTD